MTRSPETVFGRAAADAYDPATHGDDPDAFLDARLAEATEPLDRHHVHVAFKLRLLLNKDARPAPAGNVLAPVSGEFYVDAC